MPISPVSPSLRPILYVINTLLGSRTSILQSRSDSMETPLHEAPEKGRRCLISSPNAAGALTYLLLESER